MNGKLNRRLRMMLIGGGGAGFIGKVHRVAATLDGRAELVAGAFSSDWDRCQETAREFGVHPARAYANFEEMLVREAAKNDGERPDFVTIATPNWLHFPMAQKALEAGFHVVCDKPMTINSGDAQQLVELVQRSGRIFALTHNYTGYPLVRQARQMITDAELGRVTAIRVNYIQGWVRGLVDQVTPAARGNWKDDAQQNGIGGAIGDIGSHAFNLIRFMTGLAPSKVSARLMTFGPGRHLDDYGHAMVKFQDDAIAMITVSQVSHGRLNDLAIEIDGDKAALIWRQEDPNVLTVRRFGEPTQIYDRHPAAYSNELGRSACRLPPGHPEAFFEAFANVYANAFDDIVNWDASESRKSPSTGFHSETLYPNVHDGLEGVRFIEQCVASSQNDGAWCSL